MSNPNSTLERWDAFLKKIASRYEEILAEAEEGFGVLAQETPEDPRPLNNAITAINMRLIGLEQKMDDTLSDKISDALWGSALDQAIDTMWELRMGLRERWERLRVKTLGDYCRALGPKIQTALQVQRECTQCGGALTIAELRSPRSVTCEYCGAVNQVTPEAVVATYFAIAPVAFAEEATAEKRFAIERLEHHSNNGRGPTSQEIRQLETMEQDYWERYVEEREKLLPQTLEDRKRFIESRMQVWRHSHR